MSMIRFIATKVRIMVELLALRKQELLIKSQARKLRQKNGSSKKIYVDTFQSPSAIVALLIFLPALSKLLQADITGYRFVKLRWYSKLSQRVIHNFSILSAAGVRRVGLLRCGNNLCDHYQEQFSRISSKRDLLNFTYRGIHIGDLIYDTYLSESRSPTVNFTDQMLYSVFSDACAATDYWIRLVDSGKVAAVCVSHTVYKYGIPARVCIFNQVPAYQVTLNSIYSLNQSRQLAHLDFLDYPVVFDKIAGDKKLRALMAGKDRITQRITQGQSPELNYLPVSAYSPISGTEKPVLNSSGKFKVLIATHDFYDSPHCNGVTLFEDFHVWLTAIANLSSETKFEWYIKNHPFLRGDGEKVVQELVSSFPNIKLIPPLTSHQQLVKEGIGAVLTVYGTIGSEYAALGLKVVNACAMNPHCAYSFNFNPKTINELEKIVMSLETEELEIDKNQVYEYIYMHYLHYGKSWAFFDADYDNIFSEMHNITNIEIYTYFVKKKIEGALDETVRHVERAIKLNNYRIDTEIPRPEWSSK